MKERKIIIGNHEYTMTGLIFSRTFGAFTLITMVLVFVASFKYIFT